MVIYLILQDSGCDKLDKGLYTDYYVYSPLSSPWLLFEGQNVRLKTLIFVVKTLCGINKKEQLIILICLQNTYL